MGSDYCFLWLIFNHIYGAVGYYIYVGCYIHGYYIHGSVDPQNSGSKLIESKGKNKLTAICKNSRKLSRKKHVNYNAKIHVNYNVKICVLNIAPRNFAQPENHSTFYKSGKSLTHSDV